MHNHTSDSTCHGTSYAGLTFSFLAGSLAGATVALLLAPHSGKDTREMMGRKFNDTADSALALKGRMVDKLNTAAETARAFKDRALRKGEDIGEEVAHGLEGAASALADSDTRKLRRG